MRFILRFAEGKGLRDLNDRLEGIRGVFKREGRGRASSSIWQHGARGKVVLEMMAYGCNARFHGARRLELMGSLASWIWTHAADLVTGIAIEFQEPDRVRSASRHGA